MDLGCLFPAQKQAEMGGQVLSSGWGRLFGVAVSEGGSIVVTLSD